jgi:hypothetical protein
MPIATWPGTWTPQMVNTLQVLKAQLFDVYYITEYLTELYGQPRQWQVVLRKMQEIYFWEKMAMTLN